MPLVSLLDLEKVNQMMNTNQNPIPNNLSELIPNNINYLLNNNVNKNNLFANALLQQFQNQNLNNKLFSNNIILNCLQANAQLISSQNTDNQKQINYSRYKTELCRQFIENGECKYGDKCQFAHGIPDLKDVNRHPKYKTDYCKTFHSKGFCPYGPRCHFIHELHEKFDPSIQNISSAKKTKTPETSKPAEDTQLIDKQLEAIQAQLASSLFVTDDVSENFTVNDSKNQLADSGTEKQNNVHNENSNSSFSSGPSSPITSSISSNSTSSYASSTSVSSSTSPVNRNLSKKPMTHEQNIYNKNATPLSCIDNTIKNIFDGNTEKSQLVTPGSTSPMITPRTRSSTSSTSSTSSSSSFDLNVCDEPQNLNNEIFSPVKQHKQQSIQSSFNVPMVQKNLGPIGRPLNNNVHQEQTHMLNNQQMFDMDRINNLLMHNSNNFTTNVGNRSNFNTNILNENQKNFPPTSEFNNYGNFYQNPFDRQSNW